MKRRLLLLKMDVKYYLILFLRKYAEKLAKDSDGDFFASDIGGIIRDRAKDFALHAVDGLSAAVEYINSSEDICAYYYPAFSELLDFCKNLFHPSENYK